MCKIMGFDGKVKECKMILVNYNNCTYSTLFFESGLKFEKKKNAFHKLMIS